MFAELLARTLLDAAAVQTDGVLQFPAVGERVETLHGRFRDVVFRLGIRCFAKKQDLCLKKQERSVYFA